MSDPVAQKIAELSDLITRIVDERNRALVERNELAELIIAATPRDIVAYRAAVIVQSSRQKAAIDIASTRWRCAPLVMTA